jgi:hypothetical protein
MVLHLYIQLSEPDWGDAEEYRVSVRVGGEYNQQQDKWVVPKSTNFVTTANPKGKECPFGDMIVRTQGRWPSVTAWGQEQELQGYFEEGAQLTLSRDQVGDQSRGSGMRPPSKANRGASGSCHIASSEHGSLGAHLDNKEVICCSGLVAHCTNSTCAEVNAG